jgi:hypothetical protein
MARLLFESGILNAVPPWLRRSIGGRLMRAFGAQIDLEVDRAALGVKARFPAHDPDDIDEASLAAIGRERRIRRGPNEDAETYARRLRGWWDAHRGKGGPYELLRQLDAFFEAWLDVRMDVVYASGTRRWIDADSVVTKDAISWGIADGSGKWARVWVFFHVPATIPGTGEALTTLGSEELITQGGESLITDGTVSPAELSDEEREIFKMIPREWTAAHVDRTRVVLLWGARRLWRYPQPVPTWTAWGATSTWGEPPVVLEITE